MALGTQNNTRTSIEASVADNTYLNIETTLIENQLTGGRLRTDIMVFSPKGNSTRLGSISPYAVTVFFCVLDCSYTLYF